MLTLAAEPRMGRGMHALLAHAYHLALLPIHLAMLPVWRSLAACLAVALLGRTAARETARIWLCGLAVLAGWLVLASPSVWTTAWPPAPLARLPALAVIVMADWLLRARRWRPWLRLSLTACAAAWCLRGAPSNAAGIAGCVPVVLGLAAAFPVARSLARRDAGWAMSAASAGLAAALAVTGAAPHWARAALVPAAAALGMFGLPEAMPLLSGMVVAAAADALVASDRGRLIPVDVACLAPLLAWVLVPRLVSRLGRQGPAVAAAAAVLACLGLAWSAVRILAPG